MIVLRYNNATQSTDLATETGAIVTDELLDTAVLISLFTRRRADDDDALPDPRSTDRGGWWGDSYADIEGDLIGSKLWLLSRSKATSDVLLQAKAYALEALQWLIDDGIADSIDVEVERVKLSNGDNVLSFRTDIYKPTKPASRWSKIWQAHLEQL
jgi:phage gp46-like protein